MRSTCTSACATRPPRRSCPAHIGAGTPPGEYEVRVNDYWSDAMPGRQSIRLQAGDLAFFHVNSIHRGLYSRRRRRRTIAVTWGTASRPRPATREDMDALGGYVASYQPWFTEPDYLQDTCPTARETFERFTATYRDNWGRVVHRRPEPGAAPLLRRTACGELRTRFPEFGRPHFGAEAERTGGPPSAEPARLAFPHQWLFFDALFTLLRGSEPQLRANRSNDLPGDVHGRRCLSLGVHVGGNAAGESVGIPGGHVVLVEDREALAKLPQDIQRSRKLDERVTENGSLTACVANGLDRLPRRPAGTESIPGRRTPRAVRARRRRGRSQPASATARLLCWVPSIRHPVSTARLKK